MHPSIVHRDTAKSVNSEHSSRWTSLPTPFHLGPLDQLGSATTSISVVYIYESSTQIPEPIGITKLRKALQYLLDSYPHLTGRLHVDPTSNRRTLHQFGSGVDLIEARCCKILVSLTQPRLGQRLCLSDLPDGGNELLALWQSDEVKHSGPLLSIQHTRFECGAVSLGIRISHVVTDAAGLFQLCTQLAEIYRSLPEGVEGNENPRSLAHITSYLAGVNGGLTSDEIRSSQAFVPDTFRYPPQSAHPTSTLTDTRRSVPTTGRFLYFSKKTLHVIKVQSTDQSSPDSWITTFDALSAYLYQAVHGARLRVREKQGSIPPLSRLDFYTVIDLRNRLPQLGPTYFPNARMYALLTCSPTLMTGPTSDLAKMIHRITRTTALADSKVLNDSLRWLAVQPDISKVTTGFQYGSGSLMVSQWNKFNLYGTAFEDDPVLVSTPFTPSSTLDGLVYFLPAKEEDGVQVCMALDQDVWAELDMDPAFKLSYT
jgi:hypothetical protein